MQVQVRMLTSIAGSLMARPGEIVTIDRQFADRLIATDQAELVSPDRRGTPSEATVRSGPPESAIKSRSQPRRKKSGGKRGSVG